MYQSNLRLKTPLKRNKKHPALPYTIDLEGRIHLTHAKMGVSGTALQRAIKKYGKRAAMLRQHMIVKNPRLTPRQVDEKVFQKLAGRPFNWKPVSKLMQEAENGHSNGNGNSH